MEKLNIDIGLKSYQIVDGGALLIFNPSDPNVYARYRDAIDKLNDLEKDIGERANAADSESTEAINIMQEADARAKEILNGIFGGGNDFDAILRGVNLMAITGSGTRVIESLMDALTPIMVDGARACADTEVQKARMNREQRRAAGV